MATWIVGAALAAAAAPVSAAALDDLLQVDTGGETSCALVSGGTAVCWGMGLNGQLGNGGNSNSPRPVVVKNVAGSGPLTGVLQVSVGGAHACARTATQVLCWGFGTAGQLGQGTGASSLLPVVVRNPANTGPLTGVADVEAGGAHTCVLLTSTQVRCFGNNPEGRLGDGTKHFRLLPVAVEATRFTNLKTVISLEAGDVNTCAVLATHQARCWGNNVKGQVGDGSTTDRTLPSTVRIAGGAALTGVLQIAIGNAHVCAAMQNGSARCWGWGGTGALGQPKLNDRHFATLVQDTDGVGTLAGVVQVSAGDNHSCARLSTSAAVCWGGNGAGQAGDGTLATPRKRPVFVLNVIGTGPLGKIRSISSANVHSCVLVGSDEARCWGGNGKGQVGDDTNTTPRKLPRVVVSTAG